METQSSTSPHVNAEPVEKIYHITCRGTWEEEQSTGLYHGDTLASDGFIHCSRRQQVQGTANRYFKGQKGLVLLEIDPQKLQSRLVFEATVPGELFPHIYGPMEVTAVLQVFSFEAGPDGLFAFPG